MSVPPIVTEASIRLLPLSRATDIYPITEEKVVPDHLTKRGLFLETLRTDKLEGIPGREHERPKSGMS